MEGLPDRDFYYLIGARVRCGDLIQQHNLWAENIAEEEEIWNKLLNILAHRSAPRAGPLQLTVCTEQYRKKIRQEIAKGEGQGVCWEAGPHFALLYRQKRNTTKFLTVVLSLACGQAVHSPSCYSPSSGL